MSVVCYKVEVSATSWSLVQRSPTDCGASLFVIEKPQEWGGSGPLGGRYAENKKAKSVRTSIAVGSPIVIGPLVAIPSLQFTDPKQSISTLPTLHSAFLKSYGQDSRSCVKIKFCLDMIPCSLVCGPSRFRMNHFPPTSGYKNASERWRHFVHPKVRYHSHRLCDVIWQHIVILLLTARKVCSTTLIWMVNCKIIHDKFKSPA